MNRPFVEHIETLSDEKLTDYADHYADSRNMAMLALIHLVQARRELARQQAEEAA